MSVRRNAHYFLFCFTYGFFGLAVAFSVSGDISIRRNTQRPPSLTNFDSCVTLKGDSGQCKPPVLCLKTVRLSDLNVCRVTGKKAYICCPSEEIGHKPFTKSDHSRLPDINSEIIKGHHVHSLFAPEVPSAINPTSESVFDSFYPKVVKGPSLPQQPSFQDMQIRGSSVIHSFMEIGVAHSSGSAQIPISHFQGSIRSPALVKRPSFPFDISQRPSSLFPVRQPIPHHISQSDEKITPHLSVPSPVHLHSAVTENYRGSYKNEAIHTGSAELPSSHFQGSIRNPTLVKQPSFSFDISQRPSFFIPAREPIPQHISQSDKKVIPDKVVPSPIYTHTAVTEIYRDTYRAAAINTAECGRRRDAKIKLAIMPLVLGGQKADAKKWPWMVSIRKRNSNGKDDFLCGGSLITKKHVLTAAHCFDSKDREISRYTVVLGSNLRNPQPFQRAIRTRITGIRVPDDYVDNAHYSDIAVVTLHQDVRFDATVAPVCLPTEEESGLEREHQAVTATGWGKTSFDGATSDTLQEAEMQIVSQSFCRNSYRRVNRNRLHGGISDTMICAGVPDGGIDACEGDSGGPLVVEVEGRWIQVGIVSFGYRCGEKDFPGVYTRVSAFIPWLQRVINSDWQ